MTDLPENVRPIVGKILVKLDDIQHVRKVGSIFIVGHNGKPQGQPGVNSGRRDQSPDFPWGLVVEAHGEMILIGGRVTEQRDVKKGDRVMIQRSAAKSLSTGGPPKDGDTCAVWVQYCWLVVDE